MSARFATLLTASAFVALAQPALADDHLPEMEAETVWVEEEGVWDAGEPVSIAYDADLPAAPQGYRWVRAADYQAASAPRMGYSPADREAWLADCTIMLTERQVDWDDYYGNDDVGGGLIGGLLGAIVGGVAGNRIADGDRLAGTLIGGGIGGIAGAVIGAAIDGDDDDDYVSFEADPYAAEYCAAYLRRYEAQGMSAIGGHSYHSGQGVMMATHSPISQRYQAGDRTKVRRNCRACNEEVIEEVIVEEPTASRAIPPRPQPAPQPVKTKRISIN